MKALVASCSVPVVLVAILATAGTGGEEKGSGPRLAHMVFFQLQDPTPDSKEKLFAACYKYLSDHDGTVYFSVGTRAADMTRDVNDVEFDVALHIVFRGKADHDRYQVHARHARFIAESQANWKKVRVFDSYVD